MEYVLPMKYEGERSSGPIRLYPRCLWYESSKMLPHESFYGQVLIYFQEGGPIIRGAVHRRKGVFAFCDAGDGYEDCGTEEVKPSHWRFLPNGPDDWKG